MKTLLGTVVVGVVLLSQPAAAAPWDFQPGMQVQERPVPPRGAPGKREVQRERQLAPQRNERPPHQLTEDERRELHRDLDRANRELYRRRFERR